MDKHTLIYDLKLLIIQETEKNHIDPEKWQANDIMFGDHSYIALDSLDALQISLAIQARYGIRISGDRMIRKHMHTLSDLAEFIITQQNA